MKEELEKLILILMNGTRPEFKLAKKEIEKLWKNKTKLFEKDADVIFEYLPKFDQIEKAENQEAFVSGISFFFLSLSDEHFEILRDFALKVIQNEDGHVREAMRHTADWLYISISDRAHPFVYDKEDKISEKQKCDKKNAQKQYLDFVKEIESLIEKYDDDQEQTEFVDEMKPSVNKSLQLLWNRLTDTQSYRKLLEENRPISFDILVEKKNIEFELNKKLEEMGSDFELEDIKDIIYNEEGSEDMMKIISIFDRGGDASELDNILELATSAWGYFPHKILNGKCPEEMLKEGGYKK